MFDLKIYTRNSSEVYVIEVDIEYPVELKELQEDYLLDSNKIAIKREILLEYQL